MTDGAFTLSLEGAVKELREENARLRDELVAEEEANQLALHTLQDAYERECQRLRTELEAEQALSEARRVVGEAALRKLGMLPEEDH